MEKAWFAFEKLQSGLKPLTLFQSPRYGQLLAGEVRDDLCALGARNRGSRTDKLGWLAASQAVEAAHLNMADCGDRAGIVLGGSVGGSFDSERFLTHLIKRRKMWARPIRYHECVSTAEMIAEEFGLFGPTMTIATACSSGALAIASAAEMILAGDADVMLAGGADSLSRMTWGGFHSLLLVDDRGCRPFDAQRAGMSLGEGAAVLVLESQEHALKRGAQIIARLTGWGSSCDAYHATAPHPQGAGAAQAMQSALRRAGLQPGEINYINAHGTGTRDNDPAEGKAIRTIFGEKPPPFSSTKGFFGHALGASGAIEGALCVEALRRQQVLPNIGFSKVDQEIGLAPVTKLKPARLTHVMSNSFGFGGNNVVLIFSRPEAKPGTRTNARPSGVVTGLGVIGPGTATQRQIKLPLPEQQSSVISCGDLPDATLLSPNQRRRLSRLIQMALLAARRSHSPGLENHWAVAIGTGMGCLDDAQAFIDNLIEKDEREPMPARFPNSVHNALAAQIAIDQKALGPNSAPTTGEISFECALWQGLTSLANGEAEGALVGAADELNDYVLTVGKRWRLAHRQVPAGEGAVVAAIQPDRTVAQGLARIETVRLGRYRRPFDAQREAQWIKTNVDLNTIDFLLTGEGGNERLDEMYQQLTSVVIEFSGGSLRHESYKQRCGEFHAASAFGFARAVELVRSGAKGVLTYTLAARGSKALCVVCP